MMEEKYLIFGRKVVKKIVASKSNLIKKVWIDAKLQRTVQFETLPHHMIEYKADYELDKVAPHENHQGVVAFMKEYNYCNFADIVEEDHILVLDRIQDPHNFGAIIRSAVLFGYENIVILDYNQCPVTATVVKASAGTIYEAKICRVANLSNAIKVLQTHHHWVYASYLADDAQDLSTVAFDERSVIIIGNEGEGVNKHLAQNSDFRIKIKTSDAIDSLNASVATGVILFFATLSQ